MDVIHLDQLSKRFSGGRGVSALSLTVGRGEVFGFIGPNGAGKTTAIRAMLGLSRRTSGVARVLGVDLEREPDRARATLARIGYVPSDPGVFESMTVRAMLSLLGSLHGADTAQRREVLCARLDLDADRRADELSLGNKKKLALVAAMQHQPDLLVLDEPSNGLDPLVQRTLFELVREEKARGCTVFFSSHVLSEVERFCDRFAILRDGALVKLLRADELRSSGRRRVRAVMGAVETAKIFALTDRRPIEGAIEFETDAPLATLLDALAEDARSLVITGVVLDRLSLEELVLREYGPRTEAVRS